MRELANTAEMPDVKSRQAFFPFEIVCRDQPLEIRLRFEGALAQCRYDGRLIDQGLFESCDAERNFVVELLLE